MTRDVCEVLIFTDRMVKLGGVETRYFCFDAEIAEQLRALGRMVTEPRDYPAIPQFTNYTALFDYYSQVPQQAIPGSDDVALTEACLRCKLAEDWVPVAYLRDIVKAVLETEQPQNVSVAINESWMSTVVQDQLCGSLAKPYTELQHD